MRISIFLTTVFFLMILSQNFSEAQDAKSIVYLIPGQGADARQFQRLELNPDFEIRNIEYFTPEKGWNMRDFARALSQQIDTTAKYVIIGVSLGGMLATEMGEFLNPRKNYFDFKC
jgi:surfactin synthase thioesterase subunit